MSTHILHESLAMLECFSELAEDDLARFEDAMETVAYGAGEEIFHKGEPGRSLFIILSGRVSVLEDRKADGGAEVAVLQPGDCGGLAGLFGPMRHGATLRAEEASTLAVLTREAFESLVRRAPELSLGMMAAMSRRMDCRAETLPATGTGPLETERLHRFFRPEERRILESLNWKVASAESLDRIMDYLFESLGKVGPCDRLDLAFLEDGDSRYRLCCVRSNYQPLLLTSGFTEDVSACDLDVVFRDGRPRACGNLKRYLRSHPESESTRLLVEEGIRSSMNCPLMAEGRPIGFLFRNARAEDAFDEHQITAHRALATQLCQAVDKARRIEQLTNANKAYMETLSFVTHELRSPLTSLVMDGDVLLEGYLGELKAEQEHKVGRMLAKANYLLGLIEEYINLARMEVGDISPSVRNRVDLTVDLIDPALEMVEAQIQEKGMTVRRDFPRRRMRVSCDPTLMRIVLVNLFGNAAKYGDEGGEIAICAHATKQEFEVSVRNSGPGFPPEARSRLFRRFSRIDTPELTHKKGSGIGLYTSWRIVRLHGGRIHGDSEPGCWAEFSFSIPQPLPATRETA